MDNNIENNDNLDELVDRAIDDVNNAEDTSETENEDSNENVTIVSNNEFKGYFHERDSLAENNIVDEVKTSFLEYSMSVITSRALPDLRDGLKPVHRRIL